MAAPSNKSLQSLSGKWQLNKACSDDFASVLALQGVNLLVRKTATAASIHLKISQPDDQHIKMAQSITSGKIPGTTEDYTLDYEWRTNQDGFFGAGSGLSSRYTGVDSTGTPSVTACHNCALSSDRASSCCQNCILFCRPSNWIMVGTSPSGKPTIVPFRLVSELR